MTRPAGSIKGALVNFPPKHQAAATINQAAPVQNQWYTILDTTKNCRVKGIAIRVATTGETLGCRITIDGTVINLLSDVAAVADTTYYAYLSTYYAGEYFVMSGTDLGTSRSFLIEGRTVKVEVRKTTAAGAGALLGAVTYGKW